MTVSRVTYVIGPRSYDKFVIRHSPATPREFGTMQHGYFASKHNIVVNPPEHLSKNICNICNTDTFNNQRVPITQHPKIMQIRDEFQHQSRRIYYATSHD